MAAETSEQPLLTVPPVWWRRGDGLRLAVAVVGCLLLGYAVTWALPYAGVPMRTGPLAWRDGGDVPRGEPGATSPSYGSLLGSRANPLRVGDRFTYGMDVLRMPRRSHDAAVITKVEPLGLDRGVRYLGAMLGSPHRAETWQIVDRWPPREGRLHDPVPLDTPITSRATDGMGWELFLGFQVTRHGYFVSDGWQITYRVGARTYRYVVPAQVVICTPEVLTPSGDCPWPENR